MSSPAVSPVPSEVVEEVSLTEQIVTNENTSLVFSINGATTSAYDSSSDAFLTNPDVLQDGDTETADSWGATSACGPNQCDIRADFGSVINVTEVNIACHATGWGAQYTRDHDLEYSENGTDWTVFDVEPITGIWTTPCVLNTQDVNFNARYVRINKQAAGSPGWIAVGEFWFKAML